MRFDELLKLSKEEPILKNKNITHLAINLNKIVSENSVPGLLLEVKEMKNGVNIKMAVSKDVKIKEPIHLCFGLTHEQALQKINLNILVSKNAKICVIAHCLFPQAIKVKHIMKARIRIKENATYVYKEKHFHGVQGGVKVDAKTIVKLDKRAIYKNTFVLIEGSVGKLNLDYNVTGKEESVAELMTKVSGSGKDIIKVREVNNLIGEKARGVLSSKIAVCDDAKAEVYNVMKATAPYAVGHIDCQEIIQDNGEATSIPIVKVNNSKARITHETAIGSVDQKQLETLMARGLNRNEATKAIIAGLMS